MTLCPRVIMTFLGTSFYKKCQTKAIGGRPAIVKFCNI